MLDKIKDTLVIIIICVVAYFGYTKYQEWRKPPKPPTVVVTPLEVQTPTAEDQKNAPAGHIVTGVIKPVVDPKSNRWEKKKIDILVSKPITADGKSNTSTPTLTQIVTTETFRGISLEPKFYAGFTNGEVTLGYSQGFLRWGRVTFDGLVTFPYIGLGLGYNLTNNVSLLLGGNIKYVQYSKISDFSTYSLDVNKLTTMYPVIGGTFNF